MKPTLRDVVVLAALQVGMAGLMTAVISLLPSAGGTNSWVGAVGAMIGAQSFVMLDWQAASRARHRARVRASPVDVGGRRRSSCWRRWRWACWPPSSPETLAEHASALGGWWVVVVARRGRRSRTLMTRVGVRLGIKNLARAQAAAEAKNKPPKP